MLKHYISKPNDPSKSDIKKDYYDRGDYYNRGFITIEVVITIIITIEGVITIEVATTLVKNGKSIRTHTKSC